MGVRSVILFLSPLLKLFVIARAVLVSKVYYSHPWATSVRKMVFIIIWKVAGEFVSPKNITVGSNNPLGVRNAAFHSSPSLILMLLYPHRTSTFVKRVHPRSRSMTWGMR